MIKNCDYNIRKKIILLVDDEYEILNLCRESFEDLGFSVISALNGLDALKEVNTNNVDYILTDQNMPIISGMEFLKIIRNKLKLNIPVSFFTADEIFAESINDLDIDRIFSKPSDIEEMIVYIANALKPICKVN